MTLNDPSLIFFSDSARSNSRTQNSSKNCEKRQWYPNFLFDQSFGQMSKSGSFLLILKNFKNFSFFKLFINCTIFEKEDFLEIVLFESHPRNFNFAWA